MSKSEIPFSQKVRGAYNAEKNKDAVEFATKMRKIWIAEPLSLKGQDAMSDLGCKANKFSEETYLKNYYVEPFTIYEKEIDENGEYNFDEENSYIEKVKKNDLEQEQYLFEDSLKKLQDALYIVKAGPGCGKTTYVHHLQIEEGFEDLHFEFCDFENTTPNIRLLGKVYDFDSDLFYKSNVWKFVSIVTREISYILGKYSYEEYADSYLAYIAQIYEYYDKFFNYSENYESRNRRRPIEIVDDPDMRHFFKQLYTCCKSGDEKEFKDSMYAYIDSEFARLSQMNTENAVAFVCSILIRLYFSLNKMNEELGRKQKYVYVIDNIESFVKMDPDHPIQDCELETIMHGIQRAADRIKTMVHYWTSLFDYESFFAFLLVTRDSSLTISNNPEQWIDFAPCPVLDITNWFYLNDIFNSKVEYLKEHMDTLQDNPYYQAFQTITGDNSVFYWCTYNLLNNMYNNNYRRSGLDLIQALSKQPEDCIEYFNRKWEEQKDDKEGSSIKHLCRKYVFRILLDNIQKTEYFDKLMVEKSKTRRAALPKEEISRKNSYARKMATILSRSRNSRAGQNANDFMTFIELIQSLLVPPYNDAYEVRNDQLEDVAKILFLMSQTQFDNTHWSPLVTIKYDTAKIYNQSSLSEEIKRQWNTYVYNGNEIDENMMKYGVQITTAGSFFAKMVPDFEYFACRYAERSPALLISENLLSTGDGSYKCLELISTVRKNAFMCVDEIMERDRLFFRFDEDYSEYSLLYQENSPYKWFFEDGKGAGKAHVLRILESHIGYIQHYVRFIESLSAEEIEEKDKEEIRKGLFREIEAYEKKKADIFSKMPEYFNR